jgi:hypothetical protein
MHLYLARTTRRAWRHRRFLPVGLLTVGSIFKAVTSTGEPILRGDPIIATGIGVVPEGDLGARLTQVDFDTPPNFYDIYYPFYPKGDVRTRRTTCATDLPSSKTAILHIGYSCTVPLSGVFSESGLILLPPFQILQFDRRQEHRTVCHHSRFLVLTGNCT